MSLEHLAHALQLGRIRVEDAGRFADRPPNELRARMTHAFPLAIHVRRGSNRPQQRRHNRSYRDGVYGRARREAPCAGVEADEQEQSDPEANGI